jgi:hypothetical protein
MPSGAFPASDQGPQGSGYFPAPRPPLKPPMPRNGTAPEAATEQIPKVGGPPPGRNNTGQHPFPPSRPAMRPVPPPAAPFGPDQRNGLSPDRFQGDDSDLYTQVDLGDGPVDGYGDYPVDSVDDGMDDLDGDERDDAPGWADDDLDDDLDGAPSAGREWLIMAAQVAVSVIGGAAVWLGFNWLWGRFPQAALVAALAVIVGLVWIVRKIRRADDLQTTGLAVLVGLFVTVSPAALLLLSR